MAIQQSYKQSDLEKRLKLLRSQVYGKSEAKQLSSKTSTPLKSDTVYLYQDLLKIGLFSSAAIGIQIVLFFLIQNHILKLNFF